MPTNDAARIKSYRASRKYMWNDLVRQQQAFVLFWQEDEALADRQQPIDESRFRAPVNIFMDELLTHASREDAARSVATLLPGWAAAGEELLYEVPARILDLVERSWPDMQWGGRPVDAVTAANPAQWDPWIRSRLDALGADVARAMQRRMPTHAPRDLPPRPTAPLVGWQKALIAGGAVSLIVGAGLFIRARQQSRESS